MNINDFQEAQELPEDLLGYIFDKQRTLMEKYHPIEKANGLLICEDVPVNLHDAKGQARLKEMAWRCMEEVAEALESHYLLKDPDHTKEELADALHFFVEMCILSDISPKHLLWTTEGDFKRAWEFYSKEKPIKSVAEFVLELGCTCNCLKNKPWKQTQMLTNIVEYNVHIRRAFYAFIYLCSMYGIKDEVELFQLYFRKSQVNEFRQRSNY